MFKNYKQICIISLSKYFLRIFKSINIDQLSTSSTTAAACSSNNNKLFSSTKVKEYLLKAREFIEKRMNEEQKSVSIINSYNNSLKKNNFFILSSTK